MKNFNMEPELVSNRRKNQYGGPCSIDMTEWLNMEAQVEISRAKFHNFELHVEKLRRQ